MIGGLEHQLLLGLLHYETTKIHTHTKKNRLIGLFPPNPLQLFLFL